MSEKIKKEKKRLDKSIVIAIVLCVSLVVGIVGFVALPEPITAAVQLKNVKKFIASSSDVVVVINAPMEMEGILNDKEAVMRDDDALNFVRNIYDVLKNVKYSDTKKQSIGIWKTKIVIYNPTDEIALYMDEEGVYIENKGKLIKYAVSNEATQQYNELYSEIKTELG